MGRFNSAKSSKLFLQLMEEDKNPERKRFNKLLNRVRRNLKKDEPLTRDVLEFALNAVRDDKIAEKLKRGEPLSDYEKHMIDGLLRMTLAKP
ncbi:hypothetical protein JQ621_18425 [Bradyrhizobium manausense]|uniref:hypothetical protein n=1 Tax=Bradyrhizobium manausense TaxID=989370 RepID=UPI001BA4B838|nr:hypothetical protein [Bradyrhizobium manausense]MBR1089442.1 hypothetical protein [Bradyrhizobium manausense]